jgi:tartrate dehydratase alpha subunit/fumarate hydratase class I-like protein
MRHRADKVVAGLYGLARLDQHLPVDGQVQFGVSRKADKCTTVALADAFAQLDERAWRKSESILMELQHHTIAFIGLDPLGVSGAFRTYTLDL